MINPFLQSTRVGRVCESIVNVVFPRSCVGCGLSRKNRAERLQNVWGAFEVVSPQAVFDENILLVDDVFTRELNEGFP
jgi:hypothetical protein